MRKEKRAAEVAAYKEKLRLQIADPNTGFGDLMTTAYRLMDRSKIDSASPKWEFDRINKRHYALFLFSKYTDAAKAIAFLRGHGLATSERGSNPLNAFFKYQVSVWLK